MALAILITLPLIVGTIGAALIPSNANSYADALRSVGVAS